MTPKGTVSRSSRRARETLVTALSTLQNSGVTGPVLELALAETAAASSALYSAESEAATEEAVTHYARSAVEALTRALDALREVRAAKGSACDVAATAIGSTLALLHPVLQATLRQRRGVMMAGALEFPAERPAAAPPRQAAPLVTQAFRGTERRTPGNQRAYVEVDIGLSSESQFYAGISCDVSSGGVFVSTYQPAVPGTEVRLFFVLPDEFVVEAEGVVRWTREKSSDAPPGMGVAFVRISEEALAHITAFCSSRPPLYYEP